jgi:hypothetical protein
MSARLASGVWVAALLRRVQAAGGFGAVLAKGDAVAGSVIVVAREFGSERALARALGPDGTPIWEVAATGAEAVAAYLDKQRRYDPDLWIVELDIADAERFVAETSATR